MIQSYGRKFVHVDSGIALQYYMLASVVRGNSIAGGRRFSRSGGKGAGREGGAKEHSAPVVHASTSRSATASQVVTEVDLDINCAKRVCS